MKQKKRTSSENLPLTKHTENPTKRKMRISDSYLPDECWECVFRFIINNRYCLDSLSLVSKQFLSITNRLLFSLTVKVEVETRSSLPFLLKRFTNLNTLNFTRYRYHDHREVDNLLIQISTFPLKLTSLKLPGGCRFPGYGLQAVSQNITTLTSLTCYGTSIYCENDLLPVVNCFPLLEELILCHPQVFNIEYTNYINMIQCLLTKSPCIQHLKLRSTSILDDQHVVDFSLVLGNLVSINLRTCHYLTETTLFSLVRNCPSLSEINMESTSIGKKTIHHSGVYPQLKSLYLGHNSQLSDKNIIMFASIFPNLQLLDLKHCSYISECICQVLKKCCKLKHLNLASCSEVKLHAMNVAVPELEVLNLSKTRVDDETLYAISKNCRGLLQLLLENCKGVTEKGVKHMVENCTQLREINLRNIHVSDENRELFSRRGCHIW